MGSIVSVLSFHKDGFGIKYPTKVDMPFKKETKTKTETKSKFVELRFLDIIFCK